MKERRCNNLGKNIPGFWATPLLADKSPGMKKPRPVIPALRRLN